MLWKTPKDPGPHKCEMPHIKGDWPSNGDYYECDDCGKDYEWSSKHECWVGVTFWCRKRIRARVGIDERCPRCGPRSYRGYRKMIDAQKRARGAVMVGYCCKRHELTVDDIPQALLAHNFPSPPIKD